MKKFLGLPIFRKPLSDAEIVEQTRREMKRTQHYGKHLLAIQTATIIMWAIFLYLAIDMLKILENTPLKMPSGVCIMIGMTIGVVFSGSLCNCAQTIRNLRGDRTSLLLVKYHDALTAINRQEDSLATNCTESTNRR